MKTLEKSFNIIVIEDNLGDYFLIKEYADEVFKNAQLTNARTFAEAKSFLLKPGNYYDIVLLDLSLPDNSGEGMLKEILSISGNAPVIVFTGYADIDFSVKSLSLGISDYLIKNELTPTILYKSILYSIERKEIRDKLERTQKLYQNLFDQNPLPIYIYDVESLKFIKVNEATVKHYGYSKEEFKSLTIKEIRPPEDIPLLEKAIESFKKENKNHTHSFFRHQKKNGEIIDVEINGYKINHEGKPAETVVVRDITPQKEYEQKLLDVNQKLRSLSAHLQEAREEERIAIAREIHDELGQQLTGIKLDVSWLKQKVETVFPEDVERTKRLIESINKTINDVRKIASNLRPGVLDDLGLEAAIEWQSNQFEEQTGLKCELKLNKLTRDYGKEINTSLYRIYQESLTNIMRHSKATVVSTSLTKIGNTLILKVSDNGVGIDSEQIHNSPTLGITGMKERALMVNGSLEISQNEQGGTLITVKVPFD